MRRTGSIECLGEPEGEKSDDGEKDRRSEGGQVRAIYEKHKLVIWIVGGLTIAGFIAGLILGLWYMVLALFGFGIGAPVLIHRHAVIEERQAQEIEAVANKADEQIKALYDEVNKKSNNIPQSAEERKRALLKGLDDV